MEAHQALYRNYRPRRFDDMVGQEHVVRVLKNAVRLSRLAHAYLLSGPRGTGKTTLAKILARAVNCEHPEDGEPCGSCAVCLGQGLHTLEIDAASNRGIDEIRDLREQARYLPAEGTHKVYIVDEAHMLTDFAFNALLKTLEEPPAHLLFVLATTEPQRMPQTVLSRCQRLQLRRLEPSKIEGRLQAVAQAEQLPLDADAARILARHAEGSMRDALALLELAAAYQPDGVRKEEALAVTGSLSDDILAQLTSALGEGRGHDLVLLVDRILGEGREPRQLLSDWMALLRDMMFASAGAGEWQREVPPSLSVDDAAAMLRRLIGVEERLRLSSDPRATLLATLLAQETTAETAAAEEMPKKAAPAPVRTEIPAAPPAAQKTEPQAAASSENAGDTTERLRHALDRRNKRVGALLKQATAELDGDLLRVRVRFAAHLAMLQEEEPRRLLLEAAKEIAPQAELRLETGS